MRAAPVLAVARLSGRLTRRGALILAGSVAAYAVLEVASYEKAYPDAASRLRLAQFQDNPAVRMLQGLARNVDTAGGFVVWDGGWFLETVAAVWAMLALLRLTRADEETDRSSLLLQVAMRPARVLAVQVGAVAAAAALCGASVALALVVMGVPVAGSAVFGVGLAGFVATAAGMAAVTAQLFPLRRRATGAAVGLLAATYLLRMWGNSTDATGWLRWLSPFGWMDNLTPFGSTNVVAALLLVMTPLVLLAVSMRLRALRDTGGALLATQDSRAPHLRGLGSSISFAWRASRANLLAWTLALSAYAILIGSLLPTLRDFVADDPGYRKIMEQLGLQSGDIERGMVSFMAVMYGLAFALYACWRIGAARLEEESGRAELLLARPVTRLRWLGGHLVLCVTSVAVLALITGLATWAGAWLAGSRLGVVDALQATLNPLPVALVFLALAVALVGVRPRLTVAGSASAACVAYLLPVLGNALSLPMWVRDLSPFQHLATVPVKPYALTSGVVLCLVAAALTWTGMRVFARRDLVGA